MAKDYFNEGKHDQVMNMHWKAFNKRINLYLKIDQGIVLKSKKLGWITQLSD